MLKKMFARTLGQITSHRNGMGICQLLALKAVQNSQHNGGVKQGAIAYWP